MRKAIGIAAAVFAVALMFTGCAKKQTVAVPGAGKATLTEKAGGEKTMEVETGHGKAKIEIDKKSITEEELGVPVYPGSSVETSGAYQIAKDKTMNQALLKTTDDYDKVHEFYKSRLKDVTSSNEMVMEGNKIAMFGLKGADGRQVTVQVIQDKDGGGASIQVVQMPSMK